MAETISLFTIGGDECIGDSLPKINANAITITNSINELYSLTETAIAGIPPAKTLAFYENQVLLLSSFCSDIFDNQESTQRLITNGVLAADFLYKPYSTILSSICFTLSSFKAPQTPDYAIARQALVFEAGTSTWRPSAMDFVIAPLISPRGYRIATWSTASDSTTKLTSSSYVSLPGGMVMQFGRIYAAVGAGVTNRTTSREVYVQFPLPFPNGVLNITTNTVVSGIAQGVSAESYIKEGFDRFGFTIVKNLSGAGNVFEMWSAIGL